MSDWVWTFVVACSVQIGSHRAASSAVEKPALGSSFHGMGVRAASLIAAMTARAWSRDDELDVGFLESVDDVLALRCAFVGDDGVYLLEPAHRRETGHTELR
jgi:hypothetical protein